MILEIQLIDGTKQNVDVGDVSEMTSDEKTTNLETKLTDAGIDPTGFYIVNGEAE
jgi:hypothetical protein